MPAGNRSGSARFSVQVPKRKTERKKETIAESNGSSGGCLRNIFPKLRIASHTGLNFLGIRTQPNAIFPVCAHSPKAYAPIQKIENDDNDDFHTSILPLHTENCGSRINLKNSMTRRENPEAGSSPALCDPASGCRAAARAGKYVSKQILVSGSGLLMSFP